MPIQLTLCFCGDQVPLLAARYAGKLELALKVKDAIRAHQSNHEPVNFSVALARVLERVILGCSILVSCPC